MQLIDFIGGYGAWSWMVAGIILLALELVAPGGFLLWMGVAGVVTGLMVLFQPIAWPLQWLIFGLLSLLSIFAWLRWQRGRVVQSDRPYLNRRADRFIGQEGVLTEPLVGGFGRLVLDDTVWRIAGPDLPAGQRIRIIGNEGAVLRIEAI
ncbi:NfeD family protein [uncultured Devosia sp.]|uniref:NfeD family protein n=1 Tax=uncultured Devosia sp. TaxID=211434 RepID=UPI0035CB5AB6